jgi:hypothetical protein
MDIRLPAKIEGGCEKGNAVCGGDEPDIEIRCVKALGVEVKVPYCLLD